MANIVVFGNQKGGVGKSTCTLLCANALSQAPFNFKVAVIDIDRQRSIVDARKIDAEDSEQQPPYEVFDYSLKQLQKNIQAFDEEYDFVFIDVAGKLDNDTPLAEQETAKILMYTDWLFIPFKAGAFNLDATLRYLQFILQLVEIRQDSPRPLNLQGFINMYKTRHRMNRYLKQDVEQIKEAAGVNVMTQPLNHYTLYEGVDTYTSFYDPDTNENSKINFVLWLREFLKVISNG